MTGLVKLIGIVMLVAGVVYFIKPNAMKTFANYFAKEKRLTIGGVAAVIIGVVFLRAASRCSVPWLVSIFGILSLIKGIVVFALGTKKIITMLELITKKPPKAMRKFALIEIVCGVALIYAV